VEAEEYARLDKIWNFQQFKEELPMCVVVPGYNNNAKFRIEYNLNSIFQQNYTNYFVVVINDASTDNSDELYRKYFDFYQISKDSYAYVENKERKTALENIYIATHEYCSPDSIVLNLDADDEFIGKNVLKTFNAGYQQFKVWGSLLQLLLVRSRRAMSCWASPPTTPITDKKNTESTGRPPRDSPI
jgi:glycosyltransferase involved in cell wall biosynthesis